MTVLLERAGTLARYADGPADMAAALALRARCFRGTEAACDRDPLDDLCRHVVVRQDGRVVCTYRLLMLSRGADIGQSYAARHYDLSRLSRFAGPMGEVGRFCIAPEVRGADALRAAWGAMAALVRDEGVEMLFGCVSFPGTRAEGLCDTFQWLAAEHLASARWRPRLQAREVVMFPERPHAFCRKTAQRSTPPLLRSYLAMGGRVSDHAVIDRDLNTLHVFTAAEVATIPPARVRSLMQVAG